MVEYNKEKTIRVFHGSNTEVQQPDLSRGRTTVDFGIGFYTTQDENMAKKWACRTVNSVYNSYILDLSGLKVKSLSLDNEWLNAVFESRKGNHAEEVDGFDVVIGPVADDKLFALLEMYEMNIIPAEQAIRVMNCMHHGEQVVLKTQNAVNHLSFVQSKQLVGGEKQHYVDLFRRDVIEASRRTKELLQEFQRR